MHSIVLILVYWARIDPYFVYTIAFMSFLQIYLESIIWIDKVWLIAFPKLLSVLSFNYSRNTEGEIFELLRSELEDVVYVQISNEPYKNNHCK